MKILSGETVVISAESAYERLQMCAEFDRGSDRLLGNALPSFINKITSLGQGFGEISNMVDLVKNKLSALHGENEHSLKKQLDKYSFVSMSSVVINVPEGFNGNLLDYGIFLGHSLTDTRTTVVEALVTLRSDAASFLTNKDDRISTVLNLSTYEKVKDKIETSKKEYSRFFNDGSNVTKSTLGACFKNNDDIAASYLKNKMILDTLVKMNLRQIESLLKESVDILSDIEKAIKSGEFDDVSKQASLKLGSASFIVGGAIEYLVTLLYVAEVYINVISEVKKILK